MSSSDSESSVSGLQEDDGWEDAENDQELIQVKSLFGMETFTSIEEMVKSDREKYQFDLAAVAKDLKLDFLGVIKLVNYIRSEVSTGNQKPDVSTPEPFQDEKYLQPVLEDDAVLFSIDEILDHGAGSAELLATTNEIGIETPNLTKVTELEEQLKQLQAEFTSYRRAVEETLDKRWNDEGNAGNAGSASSSKGQEPADSSQKDHDSGYFTSYSYNEIHETMLKDTIRTDAYRDFIYEHKHLFKGKTVLDVGCGTGILSMFCAKAGAAKVIAVDNSDIIDRARVNIHQNGMSDVITCIRGKIEEVTLPVKQVDIIVSEWMGYCLLYEAMLDSVLWARDQYLAPDGLMVPSHTVLHIAPMADPEFISDSFEFWYDVYGFDMTAMMESIYDDVLVKQPPSTTLAAPSSLFYPIPLHTVKAEELTFTKPFSVRLNKDIDNLNGWVIWFDTFFLTSRDAELPPDARAEAWKPNTASGVAFTTGPYGKETHWRSGVFVVNRKKNSPEKLTSGSNISGTVTFAKSKVNQRALEIDLTWKIEETSKTNSQLWFLQ